MTAGRLLAGGLVAFALIFGAALWYFQVYAFYDDLAPEPLAFGDTTYEVTGWQGIDAASSPLKRRVCLTVSPETARRIADDQPETDTATPLVAPYWFDCFDAGQLTADLATGHAAGYRIGPSEFDGVNDYLALYEDGRAYLWRQVDEKYAN